MNFSIHTCRSSISSICCTSFQLRISRRNQFSVTVDTSLSFTVALQHCKSNIPHLIFQGDKYYRFDDYTGRVDGSPQLIRFGWRGVPDNIDAAFSLNRTVSYFFKGSLCYKYDGPTDRVLAGYPKPISHCFPGLPDNLDSAVRYYYDDRVYFFKGLYYYLLNSNSNTVSGPKLIEMKWKNICFT